MEMAADQLSVLGGGVSTDPPLALGLIGIPLALIILSPHFSLGPQPEGPSGGQQDRRLYTATAISLVSSALFISYQFP